MVSEMDGASSTTGTALGSGAAFAVASGCFSPAVGAGSGATGAGSGAGSACVAASGFGAGTDSACGAAVAASASVVGSYVIVSLMPSRPCGAASGAAFAWAAFAWASTSAAVATAPVPSAADACRGCGVSSFSPAGIAGSFAGCESSFATGSGAAFGAGFCFLWRGFAGFATLADFLRFHDLPLCTAFFCAEGASAAARAASSSGFAKSVAYVRPFLNTVSFTMPSRAPKSSVTSLQSRSSGAMSSAASTSSKRCMRSCFPVPTWFLKRRYRYRRLPAVILDIMAGLPMVFAGERVPARLVCLNGAVVRLCRVCRIRASAAGVRPRRHACRPVPHETTPPVWATAACGIVRADTSRAGPGA